MIGDFDLNFIYSELDKLRSCKDNWDGHGSSGCNYDSLESAKIFLSRFPLLYTAKIKTFGLSLDEEGMVVLELWLEHNNAKISYDFLIDRVEMMYSYNEDICSQRHRIFHHYTIKEDLCD